MRLRVCCYMKYRAHPCSASKILYIGQQNKVTNCTHYRFVSFEKILASKSMNNYSDIKECLKQCKQHQRACWCRVRTCYPSFLCKVLYIVLEDKKRNYTLCKVARSDKSRDRKTICSYFDQKELHLTRMLLRKA